MKKRLLAALIASAVMLTAGCSGSEPAETKSGGQESKPAQTEASSADNSGSSENNSSSQNNGGSGENEGIGKAIAGYMMSVNSATGKMNISRAAKKSSSMGESDTWTIFIYLCGTDLESGQGSAASDIVQMLNAEASDKLRFVIQTGGTSQWQIDDMSTSEGERYVIQNGDMYKVGSVPLKSMGNPDYLSDFLSWGVENFAAERMGVIFWDHGGGSISGACFDELYDSDSLSLAEINTALSKVYANMTDKFEFIGFDCCLMGTIEIANVLATYARYFYGSQETEPGSGWDYTTFGTFLAQNPSANGAELGEVITDSFYEECAQGQQENEATFTIVDLEKLDDLIVAFNDYSKVLYEAASNDLAGIVRGANSADNFGGNNKSEGYTNMVDLGGIVKNCSAYADGSAVLTALENCIVYNKNGSDHTGATGLSIYYPLQIQGSNELGIYSGICVSPYYLSLVDMVSKGYSDNGYTNEVFFTEDGNWSCEDCSAQGYDDSYFDYADEEGSGVSELINFKTAPSIDEDGIFGFTLTEDSLNYTADVFASIYLVKDDTVIELGETYDIESDWDMGLFRDNFDGYWLALTDGQIIATYIVDAEDDHVVYTSPVMLNGERTNLRIRVYNDYSVVVDGAWDGIDENGVASREIRTLKSGDVIVPLYYLDTEDEQIFKGKEFKYNGGDAVVYDYLPQGEYDYSFYIQDVYGDYYNTEYVTFAIDENGEIYFVE